jgi:hypothetical protein
MGEVGPSFLNGKTARAATLFTGRATKDDVIFKSNECRIDGLRSKQCQTGII